MRITLDETQCLKNNLSLQEALIASAMSIPGFKTALKNMVARGIVNNDSSSLTSEWEKTIKSLISSEDEHLQQLAIQMRECFPKGKVPGTAFYYRCNTREVVIKLKKFFEKYGEYSDEDIIKATKKFIASYHGDYKFLPLVKYFISKNKKVMDEDGTFHVVEVSELASTLENMSDDEEIPSMESSEDWLVSSRN